MTRAKLLFLVVLASGCTSTAPNPTLYPAPPVVLVPAPTPSPAPTPAPAPASHYAVLTWGASSTAGVVIYNVYRGEASGGPYLRIASGNFLDYIDTTVVAGSTYYWVVTSELNGVESWYSNEVSGTVPTS